MRGFITFVEPLSVSSGRWVLAWLKEEAPSLCAEQEGDQEFPCLFCAALTHPFCSEGGVLITFAKPTSASSGRWALAWLQEEPPSLCSEQEGGQEFLYLFCAALAYPFRSEGGVCRAPEREFGSLGFSLVVGRAPKPLLGARGRS